MERNSEKGLGKYDVKNDYEVALAAFGLVTMSNAILDHETFDKLEDMKEKFLNGDFGDIEDAKDHQRTVQRKKIQLCAGSENDHQQQQKSKKHRGACKELMIQPQEQVRQVPMNGHSYNYEAPEFGYSIDGTKLPRLPPVESLHAIIGPCGKPFQKQLTPSDVKDNQSRLSFNKEDVKLAFQPLLRLGLEEKDVAKGIQVSLYNPEGKKYDMTYKTWANSKAHVLIGGWKNFCAEHGLKAFEDWVSIWMFRHKITGKLCVALTWKRFPTKELLARRKAISV